MGFFSARLRKPQDGLFTGVVDALDTVSNSYRITFDRPGLGTHSIPDYEVLVGLENSLFCVTQVVFPPTLSIVQLIYGKKKIILNKIFSNLLESHY